MSKILSNNIACSRGSLVAQLAGKEYACTVGHLGSIPDWEDHLEKGKAIYSSILA